MDLKRQWWVYMALALTVGQCVAAVVVHLGTVWWADVSFETITNGWRLVLGINVILAIVALGAALTGALPAPAFQPVWRYFRQMPGWMQLAYLLIPAALVYVFTLLNLDVNTKSIFDAAGRLAQLRFDSAIWFTISLSGLLPLLYWGWVVPRRRAERTGALPGAGQPSRLSS